MKKRLITVIFILVIWQVASLLIAKEVILPLPFDVIKKMLEMLQTKSFYQAIFMTLSRIAISFMIAFILGTLLGILSGLKETLYELLDPVFKMIQTIPQIGYILVLLVWFKSITALIFIVLVMILPNFYYNAYNGIKNIDENLINVMKLYKKSFLYNLIYIYIPLIKGYLVSSIETCLPLSIKVGVMAEIFVSSAKGIGKQLYNARINIDMISIFAWIIYMVLIISIITYMIQLLAKRLLKE